MAYKLGKKSFQSLEEMAQAYYALYDVGRDRKPVPNAARIASFCREAGLTIESLSPAMEYFEKNNRGMREAMRFAFRRRFELNNNKPIQRDNIHQPKPRRPGPKLPKKAYLRRKGLK